MDAEEAGGREEGKMRPLMGECTKETLKEKSVCSFREQLVCIK